MKKEDNTEQLILKAAEEEFLEKGFVLAKTTEIARRAGVTHAMLHYYYRTKENLFEQVFRQKVQLVAKSLDTAFDEQLPFAQQLETLIQVHFEFIQANPRLPFFILNEIYLDESIGESDQGAGCSGGAWRNPAGKPFQSVDVHFFPECHGWNRTTGHAGDFRLGS